MANPIYNMRSITWKPYAISDLHLLYCYRRHNSHFLRNCPEDKRLILDKLGEWEPICKFINVDVPDFEFPHENQKKEISANIIKGRGNIRELEEVNLAKIFARENKEAVLKISIIITVIAAIRGVLRSDNNDIE